MLDLPLVTLGRSALRVTPIALGTMTFGQQVGRDAAFAILDAALDAGLNFIDTAEMYAVPARRETYGATEAILGEWFEARPGVRQRVVLASKVAGPARGMDWIRGGASDLTPAAIEEACDASLRRLRTDCIDLYQIHWPNRNAAIFGGIYFDPAKDREQTSIAEQLRAMQRLQQAGKILAFGLSNESPWGLMEFIRVAEREGLPRPVSVQNAYALVNRAVDNGLDEALHHTGVGLLAYSPLGFGTLTGKYDAGIVPDAAGQGRLAEFASMRNQRWARADTLAAAAEYNALARAQGLTPTQMALAFCYRSWRVASTIIGVTTLGQLRENLAAWGTTLAPDLLAEIDAIRWRRRDPAQ